MRGKTTSLQYCSIYSAFGGIRSHDINRDRPLLRENHEPRHGPRNTLGPEITVANQVTHISQPLTTLTSSDMPLSIGHEPFCLFLSLLFHTTHVFTIIVLICLAQCVGLLVSLSLSWRWAGSCFLFGAWGGLPLACTWVFLFHSVHHGRTCFKESCWCLTAWG